MSIKLSFILPSPGNIPIGGFKIVYEYANRLTDKGYEVNLIHRYREKKSSNPTKKLYRYFDFKMLNLFNKFSPNSWFQLNKKVKCLLVPYIENEYIPDADVIFATEWTTAEPVLNLEHKKGRKLYFIQSLETWLGSDEKVLETWKFPLKKIVISNWLCKFAESLNEKCIYIPNGLDFHQFGMDIIPEQRNKLSILMLYHLNEVKGSIYGLEALERLRGEIDGLNVIFFSAHKKSFKIPTWISYYHLPNQKTLRKLYNNAAIFISPSLFEGFPLPPAEAMQCGCAVVATDIGGHREYCINNKTALLTKTRSAEDLCNKVKELIDNNDLRINIAYNGNKFINQFTWEKAIKEMEQVISSL
jgi:glycosyltransferase involved in cell wall biosynthesis